MIQKGQISQVAAQFPAMNIADSVNEALCCGNNLVITAPPGAGKSTVLPLTILEGMSGWKASGKIIMLEPRRLAARSIAERMAFLLGEEVGHTVGYRIRFENRVSPQTKIEVVTERILTKMLSDDPTLEGVDCIIFDEFHERSLDSDLALAMSLESQRTIRDDLRIVIMSATIDSSAISSRLGCRVIESEGKMFPVDIEYCLSTPLPGEISRAVVEKIRDILRDTPRDAGDILAFLPGEAEIRKCAESLSCGTDGVSIYPLYGMLSSAEQQRAIAPSLPGERKVVLATPIAETSLTIEGVRFVVDSGLFRKNVFNPQTSLCSLETQMISLDMAAQRAGRAGRTAPGKCWRLWSQGTQSRMAPSRTPQILEDDLSTMLLDIAVWGAGNVDNMVWMTEPPAAHVRSAAQLLSRLGMLEDDACASPLGRRAAALPCHPRIAAMLLGADSDEGKSLACDIAALLEEKDPMQEAGTNICERIRTLRQARSRGGRMNGPWARIDKISHQYHDMMRVRRDDSAPDEFTAGALTARAYPGRIAQCQGGGQYVLSGGARAFLDPSDVLYGSDYLAIASMNAAPGASGKVFLAATVRKEDLMKMAFRRRASRWDSKKGAVVCNDEWKIGNLTLDSRPSGSLSEEDAIEIIASAAPKEGLSMFDFSDEVQNLQRRIAAVSSWHPELEIPDMGFDALMARCRDWLPAVIGRARDIQALKKIDLCSVIWGLMDYNLQREIERLAPSRIAVPSGSEIRVEYRTGADAPLLRVRLQECFGLRDTPTVDNGRIKVLMELLSPGFKPVQLTGDLRSFWNSTYFEVRKELRMRYPKHSWPEDPLQAQAVRGVKKS